MGAEREVVAIVKALRSDVGTTLVCKCFFEEEHWDEPEVVWMKKSKNNAPTHSASAVL